MNNPSKAPAMMTMRVFATLKIGCSCAAGAALVRIVMTGAFDGIGPGTLVPAVTVGVVRVLRPVIIPAGVAKADAAIGYNLSTFFWEF